MNILVLNGSPLENDNTSDVLSKVTDSIRNIIASAEIDNYNLASKKIGIGHCGYCGKCKNIEGANECVFNHSLGILIRKVYKSDVLIIGTPVYNWGISSQLQIVLKKFYMEAVQLQKYNKKVIVLSVDTVLHNEKLTLQVHSQFKSLCEHLSWNLIFAESVPLPWLVDNVSNQIPLLANGQSLFVVRLLHALDKLFL